MNNNAGLFTQLFFLAVCMVLTAIILWANQGQLSFVLDDPMIHLAMAENIANGHYGINTSEFSSPSSSMAWPFLLAVFSWLGFGVWPALLLNVVFCALALQAFIQFLRQLNWPVDKTLPLLFLLWANAFALVFIGMEHGLQLYLSVLIIQGLWQVAQEKKPPASLLLAIVLAPWVRYECLALSVPALACLGLLGHKKQALCAAALLLLGLLSFSGFLWGLGLEWLPASVLLKSQTPGSGFLAKLGNLGSTFKLWPCLLALFFLWQKYKAQQGCAQAIFAGCVMAMLVLFLVFGRFGWYYRYEIFIWVAVAMALLALYQKPLLRFYQQRKALAVTAVLLLSGQHLLVTILVPISANNIYLQQGQMARFVQQYYQKPVAVNDIGWVSLGNSQYVLDLWGLADKSLRDLRLNSADSQWMDEAAQQHNVGLAMLYTAASGDANGWFEEVPNHWQLLGHLTMQAMGVTVSKREVAFYATNAQAARELTPLLEKFSESLPELTRFEWAH